MLENNVQFFLQQQMTVNGDDFFSSALIQNRIVQDFLTLRYSVGEPKWLNKINEGRIYGKREIDEKRMALKLKQKKKWRSYEINWDDSILYYKEKKRNRCCILMRNGDLFFDQGRLSLAALEIDLFKGFCRDGESACDLCISESMRKLCIDIKGLDHYIFDRSCYNPVKKSSCIERESYLKLLLLFFLPFRGMNRLQIFYFLNLCRNFEMSSKITRDMMETGYRLSKEEVSYLRKAIGFEFRKEMFEFYFKDLRSMIELGNYDERTYQFMLCQLKDRIEL